MDLIDILIKEYDSARDIYKEQRAIQETYIKLSVTIIIALVTFVIKGDLPQKSYLVVAAVQAFGMVYILYIGYRKRCCAGVYVITERRLAKHIKEKHPDFDGFNLQPLRRFLRDGYPKKTRKTKILNIFFIVTFATTYTFFTHMGLASLPIPSISYWSYLIGATLVLALFGLLSWHQNIEQKQRFNEVVTKLQLEIALNENA